LIVHWLTPELGRIATVAKGARRPKSAFRGKLDLFHVADFTLQRSRRSELHTLREVELKCTYPALREDLNRFEQACYCALLVEQTTETETPLPGVYGMMVSLLAHLGAWPARPQVVFSFELRLLQELGLEPDLTGRTLAPGTKELARTLARCEWSLLEQLRISQGQHAELREFLHGFMTFHLGKVPRGRTPALGAGTSQPRA
jgi:DNA repair protein RecO (recombination protein O)